MTWIENWLLDAHVPLRTAAIVAATLAVTLLVSLAAVAKVLADLLIPKGLRRLLALHRSRWAEVLSKSALFSRLAYLAPVLVIYLGADWLFVEGSEIQDIVSNTALLVLIVIGVLLVDAALETCHELYRLSPASREIPLKGVLQVLKLVAYLVGFVLALAFLLGQTPLYLLSGLGALSAVLMLIFKDAILGFVAGIQLTTNRMVAHGDWIEMPNYGADGHVMDIALTTVKVQNWDQTVTTIPTYALITESFRNWRGMLESGGRRIMRSVHIDTTTIRFCDEEMLRRYSRIQFISDYLESKKKEVAAFNAARGVDDSNWANGRRLTNVGTFRAYVFAYLRNHPMINQEMTLLVRHLQPTEHGLPLQIYGFCTDKAWARFEAVQADIFDHILAVIPQFDLRVFQIPSGADVHRFGEIILRHANPAGGTK